MSFTSLASRTTSVASSVRTTPIPETTIPPTIIAYTSTFGTNSPWFCLSDMTYYAVPDGWARCCPRSGNCPVYTTCIDGSVLANDQFTETCNGTATQRSCIYGTIYETAGDPSPKIYPGCWPTWTGGAWNATRTVELAELSSIDTTTTSSPSSDSSSSTPSPSSSPSSSSSSIPPTTTTATTTPTTTTSGPSGLNNGEIAAISVSVAFAFFGMIVGIYFLNRRYKRRAAAAVNHPPAWLDDPPELVHQAPYVGPHDAEAYGRNVDPERNERWEVGGSEVGRRFEVSGGPSRMVTTKKSNFNLLGGSGNRGTRDGDMELVPISEGPAKVSDESVPDQRGNGEGSSGTSSHGKFNNDHQKVTEQDTTAKEPEKKLSVTSNGILPSSTSVTESNGEVEDEDKRFEDAESHSISSLEQNGLGVEKGKEALR